MTDLMNGVKSSRKVMGCISVIAMLTGLCTSCPASYWKVNHVSRASFIAAAFPPRYDGRSVGEGPASLGQEYVVEAWPAGLDRSRLDPLVAQRPPDLRDGGGGAVHVEAHAAVAGLPRADRRLFREGL